MMNYGFDGDQIEALKWAYATAYAQAIQASQLRIQYEAGVKLGYPEWAKECEERLPKAIAREEELMGYAKTLKELLNNNVTETK